MDIEMIPCISCGADMPKLRLEQYGYKNCVNCSTVKAYRAVTTTNGSGDNTWNDIQIMTSEQYSKHEKLEQESIKGKKSY
tara:strand:+ start:301 stop:540 length:240 start_codon:yes stop_codon:yes gene_type:complete